MADRRQVEDGNKIYGEAQMLRFFANIFIEFLQIVYASNAAPASLRYSQDESLTKLIIQSDTADNLKSVDSRPKITVKRGAVRFENRSGIGQFQDIIGPNASLSRQNQKRVTDLMSGSVLLSVISKEDLESESIASDVIMLIRRFKPALAMQGLLSIKSFEASPTQIIRGTDGGIQGWVTGITLGMAAQDTWTYNLNTTVLVDKITTIIENEC